MKPKPFITLASLFLAACVAAPKEIRQPPIADGPVEHCGKLFGIKLPNPQLPAHSSFQQGWVAIFYSLNGDGLASDVSVPDSEPKDIFKGEVLKAVKQWRFQPGVERGSCLAVIEFKA